MANQPAEHIRVKALMLIGRREYSRQELSNKLQKKFENIDLIDSVLDDLEQSGYLDDTRYAEMFIRSHFSKGHGPIRIAHELNAKGVSKSIVSQYLEEYSEKDWLDSLSRLFESKYGNVNSRDEKERAKRLRFFQYRGFSLDHIFQII